MSPFSIFKSRKGRLPNIIIYLVLIVLLFIFVYEIFSVYDILNDSLSDPLKDEYYRMERSRISKCSGKNVTIDSDTDMLPTQESFMGMNNIVNSIPGLDIMNGAMTMYFYKPANIVKSYGSDLTEGMRDTIKNKIMKDPKEAKMESIQKRKKERREKKEREEKDKRNARKASLKEGMTSGEIQSSIYRNQGAIKQHSDDLSKIRSELNGVRSSSQNNTAAVQTIQDTLGNYQTTFKKLEEQVKVNTDRLNAIDAKNVNKLPSSIQPAK